MSTLRKHLCVLLSLLMLTGALVACAPTEAEPGDSTDTQGTNEATTTAEVTVSGSTTAPDTTAEETRDPEETTEDSSQPSTSRPSQELKIMSMNLDANESTAATRVRIMAPLLLSFDPDSIGLQEARGGWINLLKKHFLANGYARVGVDAGGGKDATNGYFATYILYKEEKYNLIDSGTFWLSTTPDVPSKYGPTVDTNRTCTWALLEDKVTGFRYVHMNCHLDWMDTSVNKIQVEMIQKQIERFAAMGYPVFAVGDYNCDEGSSSYLKMLESDVVTDAKKIAEKANDIATYPSYGEYDVYDPKERPIDYIFVTKDNVTVKEYRVVDEKPEGKYISDHFPLFVHAVVHETPKIKEGQTLPVFSEEQSLTVQVSGSSLLVEFPQAYDQLGVMASGYRVDLQLGGETLFSTTKTSQSLTLTPPQTVSVAFNGLKTKGEYMVSVTPLNIFGMEGPAILSEVEFDNVLVAETMPQADILDIRVEEDEVKDLSPNAYEVVKKGTVALVNTELGHAMKFNRGGNFAIRGVKEQYPSMENGFTLELYFTTPESLSGFHSIASNKHAGGYGMEWDNGQFEFSLRIGSSYRGVRCEIQPNTTYHAVGVFTGQAVKLYMNGILVGEISVTEKLVHPTDSGAEYLCIGADSDASGAGEYPCDGLVYFVRMYTVAANDGQALYLYEATQK